MRHWEDEVLLMDGIGEAFMPRGIYLIAIGNATRKIIVERFELKCGK